MSNPTEAVNLVVATPHEDMLASIDRTVFIAPNDPVIPLTPVETLNAANQRVAQDSRRLFIIGHDAIKFANQPEQQLPNANAANLLGTLIARRQLALPSQIIEAGFLTNLPAGPTRVNQFSAAVQRLTAITDGQGQRLVHQEGYKLGIDDVIVEDLRHTAAYRKARGQVSYSSFVTYLSEGGDEPSLLDWPSLRSAKRALAETADKNLPNDVKPRFQALNRKIQALLKDDVEEKYAEILARSKAWKRTKIDDHEDEGWRSEAACLGLEPELFFPAKSYENANIKIDREAAAKAICETCSVRQQCLEVALADKEQFTGSVWGGLNAEERRELKKQRQQEARYSGV